MVVFFADKNVFWVLVPSPLVNFMVFESWLESARVSVVPEYIITVPPVRLTDKVPCLLFCSEISEGLIDEEFTALVKFRTSVAVLRSRTNACSIGLEISGE